MAIRRECMPCGHGHSCPRHSSAEEDWVTDPDLIHGGSDRDLRWGRCSHSCSVESVSSIATELSRAIRNCAGFNALHSKTSSISDIQPAKTSELPGCPRAAGVMECPVPHSQPPCRNVMYQRYHNRGKNFQGKKGGIFHRDGMNRGTQRPVEAQTHLPESRSGSSSESSAHIGLESLNISKWDDFQPCRRVDRGSLAQNTACHFKPNDIKTGPVILDTYQLDDNGTESLITGVDRTSAFSTNAAQKLDRFLRERLESQNISPYLLESCAEASHIYGNAGDGSNPRCLQAKRFGSERDSRPLVASRSLENIRQVMDKTGHVQNLQVHFEKRIQKSQRQKGKERQISRWEAGELAKRQCPTESRRGGTKEDKTPPEDACRCRGCTGIFGGELACGSEWKKQNFPQGKMSSRQQDLISSDKIKNRRSQCYAPDPTLDNSLCQHVRLCAACQNRKNRSDDSSTDSSFGEEGRNWKSTLRQNAWVKRPSRSLVGRQVERGKVSDGSDDTTGTRKFSETLRRNRNSGTTAMVHPNDGPSQPCSCVCCRQLDKNYERTKNSVHQSKGSVESVDSNVYCKPSKSWHGQARDSFNQSPSRFCEKCQSYHIPKHVSQEVKGKQSRSNSKPRQCRLEATSSLEKLAPRMRKKDRVRLIAEAFDKRDRKDSEHAEKERVQRQLEEKEWEKMKRAWKQTQNKHRKKRGESQPNGASVHGTGKCNPRPHSRECWQHAKRTEKTKSTCHRPSEEHADESVFQPRHRHHRRH